MKPISAIFLSAAALILPASAQKQEPALLCPLSDGTAKPAPPRRMASGLAKVIGSSKFASGGRDIQIQRLALDPIVSLHQLYRKEGARFAAAYARRERAEAADKAERLANPPVPQDLVIRYRIAETPLPAAAAKGGAK